MAVKLANVKVSVKSTQNQIKAALSKKAAPVLAKKVAKVKEQVKKIGVQVVQFHLRENDVLHALTGSNAGDQRGSDLQAEFGLTDELANRAVTDIIEVVFGDPNNFNVKETKARGTSSGGKTLILTIQIAGLDSDKYRGELLELNSGAYLSEESEEVIPWMAWLLNAEVAAIDDHGITFEDFGKYSIAENSRSGRAVMVPVGKDLSGRFPWRLPKSLISARGKDFLSNLFRSKAFKESLKTEIEAFLKRAL